MFKNEKKGITLISLVITIILLLILATVAISLAVDSDGLFSKAGDAANKWNTSVGEEQEDIDDVLGKLEEMSPTLKPMVTKWNIAAGDEVNIVLYFQKDMKDNQLVDNTDVTIDWGDGTTEHYTSSTLTNGAANHTYSTANSETTVTITGKCNGIATQDNKLISIEEWGYTETYVYMFPMCTNLTNIASPEEYTFKNVTSFNYAFGGCEKLLGVPDNMFANCANVTDFDMTFYNCSSLTSIGNYAFANCTGVTSFKGEFSSTMLTSIGDYAFYNCKNVTDFDVTFSGCCLLTTIGEHAFDGCSSVLDFSNMFGFGFEVSYDLKDFSLRNACMSIALQENVKILPVSIDNKCYNITKIGDYAFANCTSAKDFSYLFADCTRLESIPEHLFENTPNVESFKGLFSRCTGLTGAAIPLWERVTTDTTTYQGIPDGYNCYYGCTGLTNYNEIPDYWKNAPSGT